MSKDTPTDTVEESGAISVVSGSGGEVMGKRKTVRVRGYSYRKRGKTIRVRAHRRKK